jgi:hypothetical protein
MDIRKKCDRRIRSIAFLELQAQCVHCNNRPSPDPGQASGYLSRRFSCPATVDFDARKRKSLGARIGLCSNGRWWLFPPALRIDRGSQEVASTANLSDNRRVGLAS